MLNNIANDLDMLLSDLCQIYPYPAPSKPAPSQHSDDQRQKSHSISSAGEGTSTDSGTEDLRDRNDSVLSAHLEVFRLDDREEKSLQVPQYDTAGTEPTIIEETKARPITTLERLTKTHPIWFLTEIGRMGAVHLLKDRQAGSFIVRRSSQNSTWALSVQFPQSGNANIDHYLIEATRKGLRLQGSNHYFPAIPNLVAHYSDSLDELPLRLTLPPAILAAKTPQELASLALLGQDFWTSPMAIQAEKLARLLSDHNSGVSANQGLHKSCSEPINIKKSLESSPPISSAHTTMPFVSTDNFSTFFKGKTSSEWRDLQNNNNPQTVGFHPVNGSGYPSKENVLTSFACGSNTQSCDRKALKERHSPRNRKVHTGPPFEGKFVSSQTFSCQKNGKTASTQTSPKERKGSARDNAPALYGTTTLEFLDPPFPGYYSSNLSDRMSDYYDVWKNTVNTPTPGRKRCDDGVCDTSELSDIEKQLSNMDLSVTGKPPVAPQVTPSRFDRHQWTASPSELSKPPKVRPPPLPMAGRLKSSSIPSLNGFKSPVYSQPFDALYDSQTSGSVDDLHITSTRPAVKKGLRRQRSLPPRSLRERRRLRSPHIPKLDPILSPSPLVGDFMPDTRACEARDLPKTQNDSPTQRPLSSPCAHNSSPVPRTKGNSTFYVTYPIPIKNQANKPTTHGAPKYFSDSTISQKRSKAAYDETCFLIEDLENSIKTNPSPTSPSLNKFPVGGALLNRRSFSDSSTVEDLISYTAPQCTVKALQPLTLKNLQRVSQYDNLMNPYRPSSVQTASSVGTVFCKPWDSSPWEKLLKSESPVPTNGSALSKLPLERSVPEKISAWQDANKDYQLVSGWDTPPPPAVPDSPTPGFSGGLGDPLTSSTSTLTQDCDVPVTPVRETIASVIQNQQESNHCEQQQTSHVKNNGVGDLWDPVPLAVFVDVDDESEDDLPLPIQEGSDQNAVLERLKPMLSGSRLSHTYAKNQYSGVKVREYIYSISQDETTTFGSTISNFIQCTKESREQNPQIVMRNVRQFMNGIKNYLVKHGEGELESLIELQREKLEANEILNIDAIIEGALHKCVIHPLKHHIYRLFVEQYKKNGGLQLLSDNIKYARTRTTLQLGIKAGLETPPPPALEIIKQYLTKMQKAYSPLKKLENLLGATSAIYNSVQSSCEKGKTSSLGADDFLPMFVYVLVHCGLVAAEIEAEYMWGLLQPSVLTGEGGYYLTTLSSAVLVLRNMRQSQPNTVSTSQHTRKQRVGSVCESEGFLRVGIPDELQGQVSWHTLPLRANMTTRDVCLMLAHKLKVTNPQDYGLYLLTNGNEKLLADTDCPQTLRCDFPTEETESVFAYKRLAANIAWPKTFKQ